MELFMLITILVTIIIIMRTIDIARQKPNTVSLNNTQNEETTSFDKIVKQQTIAKLIEQQNTIKNLTILNTVLLIIIMTIIAFIIVKVYPYLDSLKEYYQILEDIKDAYYQLSDNLRNIF